MVSVHFTLEEIYANHDTSIWTNNESPLTLKPALRKYHYQTYKDCNSSNYYLTAVHNSTKYLFKMYNYKIDVQYTSNCSERVGCLISYHTMVKQYVRIACGSFELLLSIQFPLLDAKQYKIQMLKYYKLVCRFEICSYIPFIFMERQENVL